MKSIMKAFLCLFCCTTLLICTACDTGSENNTSITITNDGKIDINGVIPEKETLIQNLKNAGYTITEYTSVGSSDLTIDRLIAENGSKFIDITYGLSDEDAGSIFEEYCAMYKEDGDYYILALNVNFVYCVSDKETFSTAGFKSTSNIGIQHIKY